METLVKGIELVAREEKMVHVRIQLKNTNTLAYLGNQVFELRMKMNDFSRQTSCTSLKFSFESLMDEIQPVVTEKNAFDYRDGSVFFKISWNFRTMTIWMQRPKQNKFFFRLLSTSVEFSVEAVMEQMKPELRKTKSLNLEINQK